MDTGTASIRDLFDPRELVGLLRRRKWLIVLPVVLVTAVAFAGSYLLTPVYESSVIVYMGNPIRLSSDIGRMLGEFRELAGPVRSQRTDLEDFSREIGSLPYLSRVIDSLKLDTAAWVTAAAQKLVAAQPDLNLRDAKVFLVAQQLKNQIRLELVGSEHLKIIAQGTSAQAARTFADVLGNAFVTEKSRQNVRTAMLTLDFSYEQLERYEKELQDKVEERTQLEKQIGRMQTGDPVSNDVNRSAIASEIERSNQEIAEGKVDEGKLITSLGRLAQDRFELKPSAALTRKKSEQAELLNSLQPLALSYPWAHAEIGNLKLRLARAGDGIDLEQDRLVSQQYDQFDPGTRSELTRLFSIRQHLDYLYEYVNALRLVQGELDKRVGTLPEYKAKLDQLGREVDAAQRLYDRFKSQLETYEVSQALLQESRYEVVEQARISPDPVKPDRMLIVAAGLFAGLFLGGGIIFLLEYSDRSLKRTEDVERYLDLAVVGVIPKIEQLSSLRQRP